MKTLFKIIFALSILSVVSSCNTDDHKIKFTFLQLNDVYEISAIGGGEFGGMDRVETLHQQLLKENPNTLCLWLEIF